MRLTAADRAGLRATVVGAEDRLMERVLELAHAHGYTRYTSTLVEAWRMSIVGLTGSVLLALDRSAEVPEMGPDDDPGADPLAAFGVEEARRHRRRGVNLAMFLSLFKYYRLAYHEVVAAAPFDDPATVRLFLDRVFDRTELGYTAEWAGTSAEAHIQELSRANLQATNEKTRMLTLVESLPLPALLVDPSGRVELANRFAAAALGRPRHPGAEYYSPVQEDDRPAWLGELVARFAAEPPGTRRSYEVTLPTADGVRTYEAHVDRMQDISHKFTGYAVVLMDVTQLRRDELELRRASTVFSCTTNAIVITDGDGVIEQVNPAFVTTFGWTEAEVLGRSADEVLGTTVWASAAAEAFDRSGSGSWNGEARLATARDTAVTGWLSLSVGAGDGRRDVIAVFTDITPLKDTEARLDFLAHHDPLTGLPNRLLALDQLRHSLRSASRAGGGVAVLFLDLDRFKEINDGLGHTAGDQVLRVVAERLSGCLRARDVLARLGGDEFLVVAADVGSPADARAVADKILSALLQPIDVDGGEFVVTASLGISLYPGDALDAEALIRDADAAMYEAKDAGRNRVRFYAPELTTRASERLLLETELRRAFEARSLCLHYQPIVSVTDGRLVELEALLRWTNDRLGPVPPVTFVPLAEDMGLMPALGTWVLDEALRQLADWRRAGVDVPGLAVNVSPTQIEHPGFVETVRALLDRHGIPPRDLEVEVTEGTLFRVQAQGGTLLQVLAEEGVRIAIDDFGAGYSSLSRLEDLPLDCLKIDRAFVSGLQEPYARGGGSAVIVALVDLAHAHGLHVTAEGIERPEELAALRAAGCELAQGYLVSRPVPARDVPALVARLGPGDDLGGGGGPARESGWAGAF